MGGSNTKALYLCETIYPPEDGRSCIPPEKREKAILKKEIPPPPEDQDLDDDEDSKIDGCIREVWSFYDKKNTGFLTKKQTIGFFKDALELVALRKGCKVKDLMPPGVNMSKGLDEAYSKLDTAGSGRIDFNTFEEFINENDLDEALARITGNQEPIPINRSVQFVNLEELQLGGGKHHPKAHVAKEGYGDYEDEE